MSDAGADEDALDLFADWISRREQGDGVDFETLVRDHPQLAAELGELHATWKRLAAASDPADTPPSLQQRIKSRFGDGSVPEVALRAADRDDARQDLASALIAQLSARTTGFGRYRIRGEVARGGMGAILKIWDEDLHRHLAMKVILGQAQAREGGDTPPIEARKVARFLEEAQVTGQLDHPGIVPVHELGLDPEGRLFFTMKLVKGRSLKEIFDLVAAGAEGWTQAKALGVLLKVCEAMAYAHDKGLIHRDLKPANVMVGKFGEVHVMDWGLARILDRPDEKDIRIRAEPPPISVLRSVRDVHRGEASGSPLCTMDGDVVGTPAYMPPEQAAGRIGEVGPHSDVYAVGAMLYHLLAGHPPYLPGNARLGDVAVWALVQQSPPVPITRIAPETPTELVAICDKAMSRDWKQRYRDMSELAADLSAYLEHRVVRAYQTGAWAEARKWVERNRRLAVSLAAAIVILVVGVIGTTTFALEARRQSRRADAKADEARRNEERAVKQELIATQRANDVLSLSAIQDLDALIARADQLWPANPDRLHDYETWLDAARALIDGSPANEAKGIQASPGLAALEKKLAELEQRALPQSEAERTAEIASHPRAQELERKRSMAEWMARMLGKSPWPDESEARTEIDRWSPPPADAEAWNAIAFRELDPETRSVGGEMTALLCAQRAVAAAGSGQLSRCLDTLVQAQLNLGRFDDAREQGRRALELAPADEREHAEHRIRLIENAMDSWRTTSGTIKPGREKEWRELTDEVAELERLVSARRNWSFSGRGDLWWHKQLAALVERLKEFADPNHGLISTGVSMEHGWGVAKRAEFATTIEERSVTGAEAKKRWGEAIASIRDPTQCPRYAGLVVTPQLGLLPIGRDEESGLWEFAHLQTGEPAARGANGKLIFREETGLVFVLIPGGSFLMGAQKSTPTGRNYDPQAAEFESPVHLVTLSPFFLSKYEMTQGQWLRITGRNPSKFGPAFQGDEHLYDLTHPVEHVSWIDCVNWLRTLDLDLPTEAQWEYGCRGGTETPWWTGRDRESLRGHANLADHAAARSGAEWTEIGDWPDLDDGWGAHAPVGTYAPNPFGLHEVIGNVCEWCADFYGPYSTESVKDPRASTGQLNGRVYRGGCYTRSALNARSAARATNAPDTLSIDLGVRPARGLTTR